MSADIRPEAKDTIFIGKKPLMAYVTSSLIQLANHPKISIRQEGLALEGLWMLRKSLYEEVRTLDTL